MKTFTSAFFLIIIFAFNVFSQPWMSFTEKENPNFFEIKEAFYEYSKTREDNFKGIKQYKRWEWFYEARVDETGRVPAEIYWNETNKLNAIKENTKETSNWQALGPFNIPLDINTGYTMGVGRVNCIEFHPTNPDTYWIGTPVGGVWKTNDNGSTWETTTDELLSIGISDIVVNPLNPEIIYIATGDRDASDIFSVGVLKSYDGGDTWNTTGLSFNLPELTNVNEILINPVDTNILLAATSVGIFKSDNSGASWYLVSEQGVFKDMEYQYGNFNIIVASTYNRFYGNTNIYRSIDGGNTWDLVTEMTSELVNAARITFGTTSAAPGNFYAVSCTRNTAVLEGVYKSTDAGATWEKLTDENTPDIVGYYFSPMQGYGQGWYDLSIAISPNDPNEILVGGVHIWKSTDGGYTYDLLHNGWTQTATWIHCDYHEFRYSPLNNRLFSGGDGGIHFSDNYGTNWNDISSGLQILQSYRIDASTSVEDLTVIGNQDNGSMRLMNGEVTSINGGDGMDCLVDYSLPNFLYTSIQFGEFYRSGNYGQNWIYITPTGMGGSGAWITPMEINPTNPEKIYIGYNSLWKSLNRGDDWEEVSGYFPQQLHRIDVAKTNDNVIYVCSFSNVWKSTDEGESWIKISYDLPAGYYSDIEVSPVDENVIWVTYGQFAAENKVYESRNGGISWENITNNLPNLPVNCITYDKNTCDGLYIGVDGGVYYTNNSMNEWILFSENLPNSIVSDIAIQHEFNSIIAGTYGRGLWKSNTFYTDEDPVPDFVANTPIECSGEIHFTNKTTGYFDSVQWDFGDGTTSTELNPVHNYYVESDYNITLTVFKGSNEFQISSVLSITEITEPPVTISGEHCGPGEVILSAAGEDNIYWFDDITASEIIHTGEEFITPYLTESVTYYAANGPSENCFSTLVETNAIILENPTANFSYEIQNENTVLFNNTSNNSLEYLWDFGDGNQSTDENPVHQYDMVDEYSVKLLSYNLTCVDSVEHNINLLTNVEIPEFSEFKISPNPSKGIFNITFETPSKLNFSIEVLDIAGTVIFSKEYKNFFGLKTEIINLQDVRKGLYLLKVITDNKTSTNKIIIE